MSPPSKHLCRCSGAMIKDPPCLILVPCASTLASFPSPQHSRERWGQRCPRGHHAQHRSNLTQSPDTRSQKTATPPCCQLRHCCGPDVTPPIALLRAALPEEGYGRMMGPASALLAREGALSSHAARRGTPHGSVVALGTHSMRRWWSLGLEPEWPERRCRTYYQSNKVLFFMHTFLLFLLFATACGLGCDVHDNN